MVWAVALAAFSMVGFYPLALVLLFTAGFFELSFNSMAQTLVQLNAPPAIRGRVIGLYSMSALGMRTFSGITVGLVGSLTGVHWSLFGSAVAMFMALVYLRSRTGAAAV
jgi:MFS family permease